jgi:hypothetical protein
METNNMISMFALLDKYDIRVRLIFDFLFKKLLMNDFCLLIISNINLSLINLY